MRRVLLVVLLSSAALAKEPPRVPFPVGEEGRRAEDRDLRGDAKSAEYQEALKRWSEKRRAAEDDAARRARLDRILREETTRDEIPPMPREKPEARPGEPGAPGKRTGSDGSSSKAPPIDAGGSAGAANAVANLMWAILILAAAAAIAFAIYGIVMAIQRARRRPADGDVEAIKADEERGGAAPPILRDPEEWLAEARRHAAAARWIEALRCLLFASLERLHRMRFIDYQRARTNRECVRAFTGPETRRAPFGALVNAFDVAVYGQRPFGEAEYARAEAAARELGKGDADEGVA